MLTYELRVLSANEYMSVNMTTTKYEYECECKHISPTQSKSKNVSEFNSESE